jgi:hypothetical protein
MNKHNVLLQLYFWACEHDIPDQEIQGFIEDLGLSMSDLNDMPTAYQKPINSENFKQELVA